MGYTSTQGFTLWYAAPLWGAETSCLSPSGSPSRTDAKFVGRANHQASHCLAFDLLLITGSIISCQSSLFIMRLPWAEIEKNVKS
jgi:hypothetical protein